MSVDISQLRWLVAKCLRYVTVGDATMAPRNPSPAEAARYAASTAALIAIASTQVGGGGLLEELETARAHLEARAADLHAMGAQLGAVRLENERLREHATSIERARAAAVARLAELEAGRK